MGIQEFNTETKLTCAQIRDEETLFYSKKTGNRKPIIWGVYFIRNIQNNKIYVGSSNDIVRRWKNHCSDLIYQNHINKHLSAAWLKYGQDSFVFELKEIYEPNDKFDKKENLDCLRKREQYYINLYDTSNNKKGYNESNLATNPSINITEKLLNGERAISPQQFYKVVDLLLNSELNLREISDETGVKYTTVKDIYQKREYKELLTGYNFPVRSNDKTDKLKREHWNDIMNLYNLGMPAEQISREINCGISVLKNLLRKEGIPFGVNKPRYFIFDLYGNLIGSYFSSSDAGKLIGQKSQTIVSAANHGCLVDKKYKISKNPEPPSFTETEKIFGHYISSFGKSIIAVAYKNGKPEKVYNGIRPTFSDKDAEKIIDALKQNSNEEIFGYTWKRLEDVPDLDKQILMNKNLKVKKGVLK